MRVLEPLGKTRKVLGVAAGGGRGRKGIPQSVLQAPVRPGEDQGAAPFRRRRQGLGGGWYMPKSSPQNPITRRSPSPDAAASRAAPQGQPFAQRGAEPAREGRARRARSGGGGAREHVNRQPPPVRKSHSESAVQQQ